MVRTTVNVGARPSPLLVLRAAGICVLLFLSAPALGQQQSKDPPAKPAKPAPGSLEDLLSQALRNNPDIRVAEAKVREAEAELNRTRMLVAQKVVALRHSIDIARKTAAEAQARVESVKALVRTKTAPLEDLRVVQLALDRAAAEVAKLEAEMPALLGKLPDSVKGEAIKGLEALGGGDAAAMERYRAWLLLAQRASAEAALAKSPKGTMADKIRRALDKPIDANYKDKPLNEVLKEIERHLEGIPMRSTVGDISGKMDLNLGRVPLGAVIQAYTDLVPNARFVVRDYGILFTGTGQLPPDAVELHDFWKSDAGKEKPKDGASEPKRPPTLELAGSVKMVQEKTGFVLVDLGSDAGLERGHTLEVYRLEPEAKYLGTIRVVQVRPKDAVAQPVGKLLGAIKPGDKLTTKLK
jgi:hypothetical protein